MDAIVVVPLVVFLLILKYYLTDHDTATDKDRKRYAEGIALFEAGDYALLPLPTFDQILKENRKSALAYAYQRQMSIWKTTTSHSALYDFTEALSFDTTLSEVHLEKGKGSVSVGRIQRCLLVSSTKPCGFREERIRMPYTGAPWYMNRLSYYPKTRIIASGIHIVQTNQESFSQLIIPPQTD
jgi:hypothetical protein